MSNQIEIKIEGKRLTPDKFREAVESFFELIRGVAKNISPAQPIEWNVEVDKGSAVIRAIVEKPTPESDRSIDSVGRGLRSLRSGTRMLPHGFTKDEVRAARKLAALKDGHEIEAVSIKNGGTPEEVSEVIVKTADAILLTESYDAFGSIEGLIDSLSARQAFCCVIYEPIYRRDIACYLLKERLQDIAIEVFKKRSKVLVSGLIHYAKEGYPVSITADSMRIFPSESELPSLEDIQKIYKQYK